MRDFRTRLAELTNSLTVFQAPAVSDVTGTQAPVNSQLAAAPCCT